MNPLHSLRSRNQPFSCNDFCGQSFGQNLHHRAKFEQDFSNDFGFQASNLAINRHNFAIFASEILTFRQFFALHHARICDLIAIVLKLKIARKIKFIARLKLAHAIWLIKPNRLNFFFAIRQNRLDQSHSAPNTTERNLFGARLEQNFPWLNFAKFRKTRKIFILSREKTQNIANRSKSSIFELFERFFANALHFFERRIQIHTTILTDFRREKKFRFLLFQQKYAKIKSR